METYKKYLERIYNGDVTKIYLRCYLNKFYKKVFKLKSSENFDSHDIFKKNNEFMLGANFINELIDEVINHKSYSKAMENNSLKKRFNFICSNIKSNDDIIPFELMSEDNFLILMEKALTVTDKELNDKFNSFLEQDKSKCDIEISDDVLNKLAEFDYYALYMSPFSKVEDVEEIIELNNRMYKKLNLEKSSVSIGGNSLYIYNNHLDESKSGFLNFTYGNITVSNKNLVKNFIHEWTHALDIFSGGTYLIKENKNIDNKELFLTLRKIPEIDVLLEKETVRNLTKFKLYSIIINSLDVDNQEVTDELIRITDDIYNKKYLSINEYNNFLTKYNISENLKYKIQMNWFILKCFPENGNIKGSLMNFVSELGDSFSRRYELDLFLTHKDFQTPEMKYWNYNPEIIARLMEGYLYDVLEYKKNTVGSTLTDLQSFEMPYLKPKIECFLKISLNLIKNNNSSELRKNINKFCF